MIENAPNGQSDRLLNESSVLSEKFNDSFSPLTYRRMWTRGEMPHPIKLGGQNFWWESAIDRALEFKAAESTSNFHKKVANK